MNHNNYSRRFYVTITSTNSIRFLTLGVVGIQGEEGEKGERGDKGRRGIDGTITYRRVSQGN